MRIVSCSLPRLLVMALLLTVVTVPAIAERPVAPRMLPESTVLYLRARDLPEMIEKFNETGFGKILADEQIKPLVAQLYGTLGEAFAEVDNDLGVSLDAMLTLPQGEATIALVAPPGERPVLIAWLDVGNRLPAMRKLLERGEQALRDDGATFTSEKVRDVEFRVWDPSGEESRRILYFEKESTIVLSNNLDFAKAFLDRWEQIDPAEEKTLQPANKKKDQPATSTATLADNKKFTSIMSRCRGAKDQPPQFSWFIDPVELARSATRGNAGAQTGIALLPVIGLDGLKGIGGSVTMATEDFDLVNHIHVLTDSPRRGVLKMIALESGDVTPEEWVPADCARYTTMYWDVDDTYKELTTLFDSFRGEGQLKQLASDWVDRELGIEFEKDLIEQFGGRVSACTYYERPIVIGSEVTVAAIQVKDPKQAQAAWERVLAKFPEGLEKQTYGGQTLYKMNVRRRRGREQAEGAGQRPERPENERFRRAEPGIMLMGDRLFFSNQLTGLHKVIGAANDNDAGLAEQLDYKLITSKIRRQPGGSRPAMLTFHRPEKAMRAAYELATSDATRQRLASAGENNKLLQGVDKALQEHPLPPFAVMEKYLAPGGGVVVADESGFHYTGFTLRRKQ